MSKIKFTLISICCFLFVISCHGSAVQPLTKTYIKNLLQNPPQNQKKLKAETLNGCVHIPATSFIQRIMVGFEITGESCAITVDQNNTVQVSFLGDPVIPVVSTSTDKYRTDIYVGELENNQILIVQHHQGKVVSVTQTIYDENDNVVYGQSGEGEYIKECLFTMTTTEKQSGKKNCGK